MRATADDTPENVVTTECIADITRGFKHIFYALLLAYDAEVADHIASPALDALVGWQDLEALEFWTAAEHNDLVGIHAVALDGDAAIALVGDKGKGAVTVGLTFEPELALVKEAGCLAEFGFKKFGTDVVVVEDIVNAVFFEATRHEPDVVGRITAVDYMETALFIYFFSETDFLAQGTVIFTRIADSSVAFCR